MKWTWFLSVLLFLLLFFLHGCGRRLDPETLALAEESDVICLARVSTAEKLGESGVLLKCFVMRDYLGNLTAWGRDLQPGFYLYVLAEDPKLLDIEEYRRRTKGSGELFLFLKQDAEAAVYTSPRWGEVRVFLPAGKKALRGGGTVDAEGLRLQEALREYGRTHPREPVENGVYAR